jgi:hypothetical protein
MDKGGPDAYRMSFTPEDYADGVWTFPTRTVDGLAPALSNGSYLDDVAYAVWTYATRTASGGVATFSINVAQSMPVPEQGVTLQTVMPISVAQTMPTPVQAITAEATGATFEISVNQTMPTPTQSATLEAQGGVKPKSLSQGGFDYYPPIYTIRTKGKQGAPAPVQGIRVKATPPRIIEAPEPETPRFIYSAAQHGLVPAQAITVKSHRSKKIQQEEEEQILMLLMGVA